MPEKKYIPFAIAFSISIEEMFSPYDPSSLPFNNYISSNCGITVSYTIWNSCKCPLI